MPRFVILEHDHPVTHWDLTLDIGPALRTWRLASPPAPGQMVRAEPLGDHRRLYLDYEGPVSGGRGSVRRWDVGTYDEWQEKDNGVQFRLAGARTRGICAIERQANGEYVLAFTPDAR